jgi:hypothetical protein
MSIFIDLDAVKTMFSSTYRNSYFNGNEIAKILEVRYGKEEQKQTFNATNSNNSGQISGSIPRN